MNQLDAELLEPQRSSSMIIGDMISFKQKLKKIENRQRLDWELRKGLKFLKEHIIQKGDTKPDQHTIGTYNSLLNSINIGLRKIKKRHKLWLSKQFVGISSLLHELFTLMLIDGVFKYANNDDKRIVLNSYLNTYVHMEDQYMLNSIWYMMIHQENDFPLPNVFTINIMLKNIRHQLQYKEFDVSEIIDYLDDYMKQNDITPDAYVYHEMIWIYGLSYKKSDKKDEIKQRLRNTVYNYIQMHATINTRILKIIFLSYDTVGIRFTVKEITIILDKLYQHHGSFQW